MYRLLYLRQRSLHLCACFDKFFGFSVKCTCSQSPLNSYFIWFLLNCTCIVLPTIYQHCFCLHRGPLFLVPGIVMEFLPENLHQRIGGKALAAGQVRSFTTQLLIALAHLDSLQLGIRTGQNRAMRFEGSVWGRSFQPGVCRSLLVGGKTRNGQFLCSVFLGKMGIREHQLSCQAPITTFTKDP